MIVLGGGGVECESSDPGEIARAHRAFGYRAAYCPQVELEDADRIREIREAFEAEGVVLAEVGAWCNQLEADPVRREENFRYVCRRLALAEAVGARCCVDFLGSPAPGGGPDPHGLGAEAFDVAVQTVRRVVDEVQPTRTRFCLEMMPWMLPDSPDSYRDLLAAVDREAFGVHLDPVNVVVSPRIYHNTGRMIERCFELLGEAVVSCHAKDTILTKDLTVRIEECPPGRGNLDYHAYLRELDKLDGVPLMTEHLQGAEQYAAARDHVVSVAEELGLEI